ncbi:MAG: 3-keto-5-aminohexanoate cleavage protein, partial [Alphaproteobacteria bacterium]|nr:3-keto-5-aminohexanoate cleavage protein [Alphaproteobacteria bacterium]
EQAKWLSDDTRHMLAELSPKPDQVTIAINTVQMNVTELMSPSDVAGTSLALPAYQAAYREMTVPAGPSFVEEHLKRLERARIQPHFMLAYGGQLETLDRLIRRGIYRGPLNLNWVAIGGGADSPNPFTMMEFIRRVPDGAVLTLESVMRNVLPINTMAIAMGLHVRCGIEDNLWGRNGERISSAHQVEQLVRIGKELYRKIATGAEAKRIYRIGEWYQSSDETLSKLGLPAGRHSVAPDLPLRMAS